MNRLSEIIEQKRKRLAIAKTAVSPDSIKAAAEKMREKARPHSLHGALAETNRLNIIAEFKRRSPSKGFIRKDADAATVAGQYERGGAAAISVLTEEDYFSGSLQDLLEVRHTTQLPILRKDFVFEEYQVFESAA